MLHKDGSKTERKAVLSIQQKGAIRIDYKNNSGEYDIIDPNGELSFYDKDGFYKTIKKIRYKKIEFSSKYKPSLLSQNNNIKSGNINIDSVAMEHARLDFDHKIDSQLMMDFQSKKASLDRIAFVGTFATAFYNPMISVLAYFFVYDKMPIKYLIKLSETRLQSPYYTGLDDNQKKQYEEIYKTESQYYLQRRIIVSGYKGCQLTWIPFLLFIT
jgi:hypothetical protein